RSIGHNAFSGNDLTDLYLGVRLKNIDREAFEDNKLVEVDIPNSVETIRYEAFSNNLLEKVTIGSSVTEIERNAFQLNENLCEVINNSELELTQEMFPKCPIGQCDIVSDYVFGFHSDLSYDETFVVDYTGTSTEANIPNSVEKVGNAAFFDKSLTSVALPPLVKVIESSAFSSNKIQSVSFNADIEIIDAYAFADNEIQQVSFEDNSMLKRIGRFAFYGCSSSSVVLPGNANPDFHHYEDSDGNVVTEIIKDNYGFPGTTYYACKEDGTRIE
ncbi:MAG TPA: leucine-rich repeat domain-containing protein, partial [Bacteroidales bacterium]|nr:leucine-rich repeat domain-containing protein [Bacteroidales bacterium]